MQSNIELPYVQTQVSKEEWEQRVNLAACYRMVAHQGWDDLVFTHISAKVPGPEQHFLINPYGLLFEEITASNLVKVDIHGNKVLETPFEVNPAGFTIHSAVHEAREDAHCVLHLHTDYGVAVSCSEEGLTPISQNSLFPFADLSYHDFEGIALNPEEKARLVADLGDTHFMILRNHGTLTAAPSIADAYLAMHMLESACRIQILAQSANNLIRIPEPIISGIKAQVHTATNGMLGGLAWPAVLRKMDRLDPSFRH